MAIETSQSSTGPNSRDVVKGLGALEALVANRPSGYTDVGTEGMSAAPESNIPKGGGGGIFSGQATRGSQIPVPGLSTPVQAPAVSTIPPGLFCGPHECFDWHYIDGLGIGNSYEWMLRMAFYPDRTCQVVFVIQHVYAPNPCVLLNVWDYLGNFAITGPLLAFTLRGQRTETDSCSPSNNGQWPIGGTLNCNWSFDSVHSILTVNLPFVFGPDNWRIFRLNKISFQ